MATLDEIIAKSNEGAAVLLIDSGSFTDSKFAGHIYQCARFRDVHPDKLKEMNDAFDRIIMLMDRANVCILPEVLAEFGSLKKILSDSYAYFDQNEKRNSDRKKRGATYYEYLADASTPGRDEFENICKKIPQIEHKLKSKLFQPRQEAIRDEITETLKFLDRAANLKRNHRYRFKYYAVKRGNADYNRNYTDEKLVSAALYLSFFEDKTPIILTHDNDLHMLLGAYNHIINVKDFSEYHSAVSSALAKNPISIYLYSRASREYSLKLYMDKILPRDTELHLIIRQSQKRIPEAENKMAKERIISCLSKLPAVQTAI